MNIEEKIGLYVEGELSAEEQEKVALLITSDEDYKMAYTTYVAIENELKSSPLLYPSSQFVKNTMRHISPISTPNRSVKILAQHGLSIAAILIFAGLFFTDINFSEMNFIPQFISRVHISAINYLYILLASIGVIWAVTDSEFDFF